MKKAAVLIIVVILAALTALVSSAQQPAVMVRLAQPVHTYTGPGTQYARLGTAPSGVDIPVVGTDEAGTWLYIKTPDFGQSWIALAPAAMVISGDLFSLPIIEVVDIVMTPTPSPTRSRLVITAPVVGTPAPLYAYATLDPTVLAESGDLLASTVTALPPNCVLHALKEGEFPGSVAEQYNVSVFDLLSVNGLTEESMIFLQIGQVLIIPLESCALVAPPTRTPLPTLPPTAVNSRMQIVTVENPGDVTSECVVIRNNGATVDLNNWSVSDNQGSRYVIGDPFILFARAEFRVCSAGGSETPIRRQWGQQSAVWESGDTVVLSDGQGNAQATYSVP